jgi:uncharacterized OB-fold protein
MSPEQIIDPHPLPLRTLDAAPFWAGCRDRELLVQRCADCATFQFYPRAVCASCGSDRVQFLPVSGRGAVFAFTVCHRPLAPRFTGRTPYVVALVDLDEGPRMMTNIVGCPDTDVHIGMAVQVRFEQLNDDVSLPVFAPIGRDE